MRCKPFDQQAREALRALNFTVAGDGETASLSGSMTIEIVCPADGERLQLEITLLTGERLNMMLARTRLLEAAGIESNE